MFNYLFCCRLCVSSFGEFPVFTVSRPIYDFYAKTPTFYAKVPCYLGFYAWCAAEGGGWGVRGGSLGSIGGVLGLVFVLARRTV